MGFKKLIIFLFLGLLIFGCAKNRGISYPSWYLNSLPNDNAFFYATGNGDNTKEAVDKALNQVASKISVEISSTYQSEIQNSTSSGYSKNSQQNINSRVSNIKFNNYQIVKQEAENKKVFLLLKVNKRKLAKNMRDNFISRMGKFDSQIANFRGSVFQKLKMLKKIAFKTDDLKNDFLIIDTIVAQNDKSNQLSRISDYANRYQNLKNQVTFFIKENETNGSYRKILSNIITKKGYNVVDLPTMNTIIIYLTVSEKKITALDKKILKSNINLKLTDKNSLNDNFSIQSAGSSVQNYQVAKEISIKNFGKKVERILSE